MRGGASIIGATTGSTQVAMWSDPEAVLGLEKASEAGAGVDGFKQFILRGNVVDLAVGVVIGAAFGTVVHALLKDLITPLLGAFGGVPDFSAVTFTVNNSRVLIGDFINALLSFLMIAAVVYWFVVIPVNRLTAA